MKTVTKLTTAKVREALEALEQAYAYFTPEPLPKTTAPADEQGHIAYYSAA